MKTNKSIGVVGSRDFVDKTIMNEVLNDVIKIEGTPGKIISGGALGADTLSYEWAVENNIDTLVFEPRYNDFPKNVRRWMAPKERNTTIVENSDIIIAFWNMTSTGTKDTLDKSVERGKKVYLYNTLDNKLTLYND
jgi:hypothetical protein